MQNADGKKRIQIMTAIIAAIFTLLMCAAINTPEAWAATCSIEIDGNTIKTDAEPVVEDGTTLVPISVITGYLGGTSTWSQSTKTATIKNGSTTIVLTIGSKTATVNGTEKTLTLAPRLVTVNSSGGGRTMLPLRFISEAFDYEVDWDSSTRTAIVNTEKNQATTTITISGISVKTGQTYSGKSGYTLVQITADKSLKSGGYEGVSLTGPSRYYIDFASSTASSSLKNNQTVSAQSSYVSKVRYGISGTTVRVVCDLKESVTPQISYSDDGKTMILAFAETYVSDSDSDDDDDDADDDTNNDTNSDTNTDTNTTSSYDPYADGKLVVCIDPGHGSTTGGKRSPDESLLEWEFNRSVAYKLKALLEAQGVTCIMTVSQDDKTDPSLASRVAIANNAGNVDLFVSIHANAFGTDWNSANGWEIYVYKTGGTAEVAAKAIESAMKNSSAGLKDRGVKTANFYVIKNTTMPAVLIEHGFYTNKEECEKLKSDSFRNTLAQADATGIMNFFKQYK